MKVPVRRCWPASRSLIAAPARGCAADVDVRVEGDARHARAADAVTTPGGRSTDGNAGPHRARRRAPAGALDRATGGDWGGALGRRSADERRDDQGRAPRLRGRRPRPGPTGRSGVNYRPGLQGVCDPAGADRRRRRCSSPSCFGAGLRPSRRRCGSRDCRSPSQPAQPFDVRVGAVTRHLRPNFDAITTEAPGERRDGDRAAGARSRRAPTASARVTVDGRSLAGGAGASQAGPRALGRRRTSASTAGRPSRRRRGTRARRPRAVSALRSGARVLPPAGAAAAARARVAADPSGLHSREAQADPPGRQALHATSPGAASAS